MRLRTLSSGPDPGSVAKGRRYVDEAVGVGVDGVPGAGGDDVAVVVGDEEPGDFGHRPQPFACCVDVLPAGSRGGGALPGPGRGRETVRAVPP